MDTTTVLTIIGMLDARIRYYDERAIDDDQFGMLQAYTDFRDHLQSFIEGQLNAEENKTVE
jgi:hypothetical protein